MKTGYGFREWSLLLLLALIWGSSFILMKRGLEVYTPAQVAALRMLIAFLCLFPFVVGKIKEIPKKKWIFLAASGFLGNGIPALLFTFAQTRINSSVAGILNSLTPLFTMIISYFAFRNKIAFTHLIGVMLGLAGAVTIIIFKTGGGFEGNIKYEILIVAATLCYAMSINIIRNYLSDVEPLYISGLALCTVGPVFGTYLFSTDFLSRLSTGTHAQMSLFYVAILAVFGTSISLILFNRLIKSTGVLFSSSVTYLIPIVALCWGLADSENLGIMHIAGLCAILAGVYLVNRHEKSQV